MKRILFAIFVLVLLTPAIARASISVQATLTADNHYGLYYGSNTGPLTFVGRNEMGYTGALGTYNWSLPEAYTLTNPPVIYVVAWDDGGPQGWIGNFTFTDNDTNASWTIYTDKTNWQQFTTGITYTPNAEQGGTALPSTTSIETEIQNANSNNWWVAPGVSAQNGVAPWGTIPDVGNDANWIWSDTLADASASDGKFVIFRTPPVPEPTTLIIWSLLGGLGMVYGWRRRKAA